MMTEAATEFYNSIAIGSVEKSEKTKEGKEGESEDEQDGINNKVLKRINVSYGNNDDPKSREREYESAKQAAEIIESNSLSLLISVPAVAVTFKQESELLFRARCWGQKNQGTYVRICACVHTSFSYVFYFLHLPRS